MNGNGLSLRAKLIGVTIGTVVALCVLFGVLLVNERSQLMADRQDKVRNLVEAAHSVMAHFEKQARDGKMSVDEAKKAAMNAVRDLRYDKVEYFWINDLNDTMVMHPIKPELDGKKLDQMKDKGGKFFFAGAATTGQPALASFLAAGFLAGTFFSNSKPTLPSLATR